MTSTVDGDSDFSRVELAQAARNHGLPLEVLRHDLTPAGLHYLLIHFDIPYLEADHRVIVGGAVAQPLSLGLDDLRTRQTRTIPVTLECAGNGRSLMEPRSVSQPWLLEAVGTAEWTGTPLMGILDEAGLGSDAVEILFTGADRGVQGEVEQEYQRSLTVEEAHRDEVMIAYEMNGRPLAPQHGFPFRLLVPGWYGMTSVKWLSRIEAITEPFEGYQQAVAYRVQLDEDEPGDPVSRIAVRSLMIPPGIPSFPERDRLVEAGPLEIHGRAWCGSGPVARVEVGVDGAWNDALLAEPLGDWAWREWTFSWDATPGDHVLTCRATDWAGTVQPAEPRWNLQGMANNVIQTVPVTVR